MSIAPRAVFPFTDVGGGYAANVNSICIPGRWKKFRSQPSKIVPPAEIEPFRDNFTPARHIGRRKTPETIAVETKCCSFFYVANREIRAVVASTSLTSGVRFESPFNNAACVWPARKPVVQAAFAELAIRTSAAILL